MSQEYFPAGTLSAVAKMDRIKAEWYSQELAALHEPSLWQSSREHHDTEAYRFLWLRSFDAPICVRVTLNRDESGSLISKEGTVHGATERGKLTQAETKSLSREQVKSFLDLVGSVKFWDMRSPTSELGGVDGSQWIMEGEKQGTYKVVDVWSAPPTDPIHRIGAMLAFDFAKLQVPSQKIY
jgi:hypothetical protein